MPHAADTLEILKWISSRHRGLHASRRKYEIRFLLTTLTVFVLTVGSLLGKSIPNGAIWLMLVAFLALASVVSGYLWFLHRANHRDMNTAARAEYAVMEHIERASLLTKRTDVPDPDDPEKGWWWPNHSWWFQTALLMLFALFAWGVAYMMMVSPSAPTP